MEEICTRKEEGKEMNKPKICIISAIDRKRGIGKNNKLLYQLPKDLEHFKKITFGHPVIMGQTTFESIGRPLPGRTNIVLSFDRNFKAKGCIVCFSIDEAIQAASQKDKNKIFFIGGASIYTQAIKIVDRLYLTVIDAEKEADTFFPDYSQFTKIVSEVSENSNGYNYK